MPVIIQLLYYADELLRWMAADLECNFATPSCDWTEYANKMDFANILLYETRGPMIY